MGKQYQNTSLYSLLFLSYLLEILLQLSKISILKNLQFTLSSTLLELLTQRRYNSHISLWVYGLTTLLLASHPRMNTILKI